MIDYLALVLLSVALTALAHGAGISPAWLLVPLLLAVLPSLYAFWTGAPHIPSSSQTVRRMVGLAQIAPGEKAADLGCGDGRLLRAARAAGADAEGYELSVLWFLYARWRGERVYYRNFWRADLSGYDVIFCYLTPSAMIRFQQQIWPRLKPGCRVVVNTFPLPGVEPAAAEKNIFRYDKGL